MSDREQDSSADKSHEPTQQKLNKSREKGDVPYSNEATAAAIYIGFFVVLILTAGWTVSRLQTTFSVLLHKPEAAAQLFLFSQESDFALQFFVQIATSVAPVFLLLILAAWGSVFAQQAFTFAPSKIKPKMSRISMVDNAKQKYSLNGLAEFVRSASKLTAVLLVLAFAYQDRFQELPGLSGLPAQAIGQFLLRESIYFCGFITIAAVMIAAVDLPWRQIQHRNRLKMTFQELKDENKDTEGDPSLKAARRRRAETIATNHMLADVPTADIIIVNPTHYAVALKWDRAKRSTPICVAKGVDEIAARIREAASAAGVPIKRDPPTARSIYSLVDVGKSIQKEHYAAVAAAIHYADETRRKSKKGYST
ncbi:MAG: flagellar type III secretion system protein FlhB [Pseudomonadota bacterium]